LLELCHVEWLWFGCLTQAWEMTVLVGSPAEHLPGVPAVEYVPQEACDAASLDSLNNAAVLHFPCAQDPLAIIGLTAIFLPFLLLLVAIATGLVDVSVYR
jgi:hypothetical protein